MLKISGRTKTIIFIVCMIIFITFLLFNLTRKKNQGFLYPLDMQHIMSLEVDSNDIFICNYIVIPL